MTDHHDDAGHGDDQHFEHDLTPVDDLGGPDPHLPETHHHDDDVWDTPGAGEHPPAWDEPHHEAAAPAESDVLGDTHDGQRSSEDPPAVDEPVDLFPPHVDVGPLPEPVDGFPWVDSSSLGLIDAGPVPADTLAAAPDPHELAAYAAEDLPPAVDPWEHLAESEDPATAALAKFYRPDQT